MKIAPGSVAAFATAQPGWTVTIRWGGEEPKIETGPVVGWATVVSAHLNDGTTSTLIQPAFILGGDVITESELREHSPEVVGLCINRPVAP